MAELNKTQSSISHDEDLKDLMFKTSDTYLSSKKKSTDQRQSKSVRDVDIPDEELSSWLKQQLKNAMSDKEDMGWTEKREYDVKAYYGIKDFYLMNYPYPNASAYPVPITPIQLDTMWSMIDDLIWRNPSKVLTVSPVGDEDRRKSKNVEWLQNWQILNDITDIKLEDSASTFGSLLHGTAYEKILRSAGSEYKLRVHNVPIENIYLPIDAKRPDIGDAEFVIQIIPLSDNDMRERIASGVYRNLDQVGKGFVPGHTTAEMLDRLRKEVTGLDTTQKITRDTWYIAEAYMTYYPIGSLRKRELIVSFSPTTGAILRKVENKEGLRPFVDKYLYPNFGRAFHMSLPEKIRNIQEKATYNDKQATDAMDKEINKAGFYESTSGFDPSMMLRAPTAMHKVRNLGAMQWEPQINLAPIIHVKSEIQSLYLEAEKLTGITDLNYGANTENTPNTLGQDVMRSSRANIRFNRPKSLINYHWKRKNELIYKYNEMYMPRNTKIKVLETREYRTLDTLFPKRQKQEGDVYFKEDQGFGNLGKFDFSISNKSVDEQMRENGRRSVFYGTVITHPIFGQNEGVAWKAMNEQAEANEIYDFESIVPRPKKATIPTPDEVIYRLMDGDEVLPDPDMDLPTYITTIKHFMRSGNFKNSEMDTKKKFIFFLEILERMQQLRQTAFADFNLVEGLKNNGLPQPPTPPPSGTPIPSIPPISEESQRGTGEPTGGQ